LNFIRFEVRSGPRLKYFLKLGQPALEFSGIRLMPAGGAEEPFNSDIGALLPIALWGRASL
jgi:hypothetical protein